MQKNVGAPGHATEMLPTEIGQKMNDFEPIYLSKYRFRRKMSCTFSAHYQPPLF